MFLIQYMMVMVALCPIINHQISVTGLTRHILFERLLLDTEAALGVQSQASNADGDRNLLVARNGSRQYQRTRMALDIQNRATIVFALQPHTVRM